MSSGPEETGPPLLLRCVTRPAPPACPRLRWAAEPGTSAAVSSQRLANFRLDEVNSGAAILCALKRRQAAVAVHKCVRNSSSRHRGPTALRRPFTDEDYGLSMCVRQRTTLRYAMSSRVRPDSTRGKSSPWTGHCRMKVRRAATSSTYLFSVLSFRSAQSAAVSASSASASGLGVPGFWPSGSRHVRL